MSASRVAWWVSAAVAVVVASGLLVFGPPVPVVKANASEVEAIEARCLSDGVLPDRSCTPGAVDPLVTPESVPVTVCAAGWVADAQRFGFLPESVTWRQIREYGYQDTAAVHYVPDRVIPVELGGAPSSVANVWPQSALAAQDKAEVVQTALRALCQGRTGLREAQEAFRWDWTSALARLGLMTGPAVRSPGVEGDQ